jgi:two-component system OmpR family sensor kinase
VYVGVVDGGTVETVSTPDLFDGDLALPDIDAAAATAAAASADPFTTGAVDSDLRYRVLATTDGRSGEVIVLALPLTDVDSAVDRLVGVAAVATLAVLVVVGAVAWWVIRLGIRPVQRMTETAKAIATGELSHRVPDVARGTEAGELGAALNVMLGRIEDAFDERSRSEDRLRRFVADASHELRTPITTIRGYAELYRTGALGDRDELDAAMRRTEQEAVRMGNLVEDMLALARLDEGRPLQRGPVDLAAIAADAGRDAQAVQPRRVVRVQTDGAPVVVAGDEDRLRQVVANVVGNALVHTDTTAALDIVVRQTDGTGELDVTDHGPGMPEADAARAFERFYRADPSRSRHRGGSGLGLAIVAATVDAHGGTVQLRSRLGEGTTVTLSLPR